VLLSKFLDQGPLKVLPQFHPFPKSWTEGPKHRGADESVKQIAWKAQDRVHSRYNRLLTRGKPKNKVLVAMARELTGFIWAAAQQPRLIAD